MRPLILLFLLLITGSVFAQTDTSYQMLWYTGKKIKPNVLLTPAGDTVTYNPTKGIIKRISKNGPGKNIDNMFAELNKTPRRMQEMVNRLAKGLSKVALPFYSVNVRRSYTEVDARYRDILSNTFNLPEMPFTASQPMTGKGGAFDYMEEDPWENAIKEFRQYYSNHANDKFNSVPVPPRYDFSYCYSCNTKKQDAYQKEMERFVDELRGSDDALVRKAFGMARQAEFLLSSEKYRRVIREAEMMIEYVFGRMHQRALTLIAQYIDDPYRCRAVLEVALSTDRQAQLIGYGDAIPAGYLERAFKSISGVIEKAIIEKDYPIALNLQMILSGERQMQLIGSSMGDLFYKAISFNQFKMNMNISAKASGDGGHVLAQIKGDSWFYAVPDSTCRLQWFLVGPLVNKTKSDLLALEIKGNGGELTYAGTRTWNSDIPSIKIDFCTERTDSVIAYPFHAENHKELWSIPKYGIQNLAEANAVLIGCFIDVKRTKEDYAKYKDPKEAEKLKKEMMAQYQQMAKNFKAGNITAPKDNSLWQLEPYAAAQMNSKKISELVHSVNPGRYIFQPTVHNKDPLIIKDKLNGKELFPENTATEYAWFHLTLEHDPDGPYRINL